jgi:hypothetical protein
MSSPDTPPPIRLDDLAEPRFSDEAAAVMAAGAAMAAEVELTPERLRADALDRAGGATDFGPDGWQEPLEVLCTSLRTEAGLSAFGTVSMHAQLVQLLTNRLLVESYLAEHPEALEAPVTAPIVVAGLPRTGTTHLHNLMSADPALRSLPYWEAIEPLPAPGEPAGSVEPRVERCAFGLDMSQLWMPEMQRMHEMTPWHTHEEIHLLAIECSTLLFDTLAPMPTWRAHYRTADQTPHYGYLRRVLQVLQHARGGPGARWVLKSPQHLEQLGPLTAAFPDATVVFTHRDPGDVTVSMVTMVAYAARMHLAAPDPVAIGAYWQEVLADLLTGCVRDRDLVPAERSLDVRFEDFMADEAGTVAAVYAAADQPLDDAALDAHREYLDSHRRNRHGAVIYEPERIGVDPAAVRARLAEYCTRFGV